MRLHRLAVSAIATLTVGFLAGDYGFSYADEPEIHTMEIPPEGDEAAAPVEEKEEPAPYVYPEESEEFEFQAEVHKMLDIVVNSLYQNKDVFLRELISNSQDALDKVRFMSIEHPELLEGKEELEIRISHDKDERSITVADSGIGMTHDDLMKNLGTVARSGTGKFMEALKDGTADVSQIGQFGVGFYSAFLVADRVRVASKHPDDPVQHVWEANNGESAFHIYDDPRGNTLGRGTEITLFLNEDAQEYLSDHKLKTLSEFYSEFLTHSILVQTTTKVQVPVEKPPKEESDIDDETDDDLEVKEDDEEDMDEEPEMEEIETLTWDQINVNKPIWTRSKDEITDDEYQAFWKVVSKSEGHDNATSWIHFNAEGNINFQSILYVPSELPPHMFNMGDQPVNEMKLYVKKVLISDTFELLPKWLSFVKGVVDSDDLPLNVNRETLQENKIIGVIRNKIIRKVLEMLNTLAKKPAPKPETAEIEVDEDGEIIEDETSDDEEDAVTPYIEWYSKFHPSLKIGAIEDNKNRDRLMKLMRFHSSKAKGKDEYISIPQYVEKMKDWQEQIYYMPGESLDVIDKSEFMEKFKEKDVDVLYMDHPVDEYLMQHVPNFDGKQFQSIAKDGVKFKDEDADLVKRREKAYEEKYKKLTKFMKDTFGHQNIYSVKLSNRLGSAPAMVSSAGYGYTANMERLMKAQPNSHDSNNMAKSFKVLELNPRHKFVEKLNDLVTPPEGTEEDDFEIPTSTKDLAWSLFDTACLSSGYDLIDQTAYSKRMTKVLQKALDINDLALSEEINPPVEEDEPPEMDDLPDGMNMDDFVDFEDESEVDM